MSIDSDFFFDLPSHFEPEGFVRALEKDLGIILPERSEYGVYSGTVLGMELSYDPDDGL